MRTLRTCWALQNQDQSRAHGSRSGPCRGTTRGAPQRCGSPGTPHAGRMQSQAEGASKLLQQFLGAVRVGHPQAGSLAHLGLAGNPRATEAPPPGSLRPLPGHWTDDGSPGRPSRVPALCQTRTAPSQPPAWAWGQPPATRMGSSVPAWGPATHSPSVGGARGALGSFEFL